MTWVLLMWVGFSTGLSGAMIPGPLFLYTVSEAFPKGRWVGVKIALGHLILEACLVALVIVGLSAWLSSRAFLAAVAWVGGVGLVVMGAMILRGLPRFSLAPRAAVAFRGGPWLGGACFSLASPGFLVWWATIGASVFLQATAFGMAGIAAVALGHALADVAWYWFVAFSVERGKAYCSDAIYRAVMAGMAVCLIALGISLLWRG